MAQYTYINGNMTVFKNVLAASGYFDTVTLTEGALPAYTTIDCKINGKTVFFYATRVSQGSTSAGKYILVNGATTVFSNSSTAENGNQITDFTVTAAYQCSGGLCIVLSGNRIVITQNQNDDVTVIFGSGSTAGIAGRMATIGAIAATDGGTYYNKTINQNLSSQTQLIRVCTCAAFDTVSFTENVKLASEKQFNTFGFITYDNKRYLFDGYFATEDIEQSGGGAS